jgi:anti-anti-sigma factor
MKIDINRNEKLVNIKLIGKYDIEELLFFSTLFTDEISKKPPVIALDLADLSYIDSSGIGSLIRYMNMATKENIYFLCYNLNKNIENVFKISKLDQFLPILSNEAFQKKYYNLYVASKNSY